MSIFKKATKAKAKLRLGLCGPAGSGKTYTALRVATLLCKEGKRVAVIDTESGSASLYAHRFDFDVIELKTFEPSRFTETIRAAVNGGYDVVVIDSLTHAWEGVGGTLDQVDKGKEKNNFAAWRNPSKQHNEMVNALLQSDIHIIVTMRSRTEYQIVEDDRGQKIPKKIGLAPVQRQGMDYEFGIVGEMDKATLTISKTRCETLPIDMTFHEPGEEFAAILRAWLSEGAAPAAPAPTFAPAAQADPKPTGPSTEATGAFKALCTELGLSPRDEASAAVKAMGVNGWPQLTDAMLAGHSKWLREQNASQTQQELAGTAAPYSGDI